DGSLRNELEQRCRTLGVPATFSGIVPNAQIPDLIARHQLFVLPSLSEGNPKALLEALACGAVVIASDIPAHREIVTHGETGFLCGIDPDSLARAIQSAVAQPVECARVGENAKRLIAEKFSLDILAQRELSIVDSLIKEV
ncbi:MAG: glycosyltransferase family 4 protein, partial [Deltaproteobacteria bacterium]|nr:glycosyltransferase family 4 protein [Deltaproteobacteria bacterium]